jgi:hypothetical protein
LIRLLAVLCWGIAAWAAYTSVRWWSARSWPAVSCVITRSEVEEPLRDNRYVFRVAYRYTWASQLYEGRTYREENSGSCDLAEADRLARAFPVGSHRVCYVDPSLPSRALLEHDPVWLTASIAAFMLAAGSMFVLRGRLAGVVRGSVIAAAGLTCCIHFWLPLSRGLHSHQWRATACVIRSGQVRAQHQLWHTLYWPDVIYHYEVDGVSNRSNTINASDMGSPWYYGARGAVRRYPPGAATTCYVNPSDPTEAVLDRTLSGTQWFGAWPLVITVLGAYGVVASVAGREPKIGTPRLWGTLALGFATTSALTILWITGADLLHDWREGVAEWPEILGVVGLGALSAILLLVWVALAADQHSRGARDRSVGPPSAVFDREIDHRPAGKGKPG